jgi:choice-of-anchor B domain-containing protein
MQFTAILCSLVLSLTTFASETFEVSNSPNVTLSSTLDLRSSGVRARKGNDIWGWTDSLTGKEYVLMGLDSKTSFVNVTDPTSPIHVADLKTATSSSTWRDIKIYKHYAFIVSEAWSHGMQVLDLHRLRELNGEEVVTLNADLRYRDFGNAHNIFINEETGFGYAVGTSTCDGGLHIMDLRKPLEPKFMNCVGRGVYELPTKHGNGYTHDVQCVVYKGVDARYLGREICISSNADTVNIVDVTDKSNPHQISAAIYDGVKYTHQGWLTEDHKYFLLGDELDESRLKNKTKTFIWDFSDLENPRNFAIHTHGTKATDHNMYVKGDYVYQANYDAGLRILSLKEIESGKLSEVGFLDTVPSRDSSRMSGAWSVFPYFDSGTVAVSGTNGVLYLSRPELP